MDITLRMSDHALTARAAAAAKIQGIEGREAHPSSMMTQGTMRLAFQKAFLWVLR